ncbi:MAG: amidohydrolase family protein, partial [Verrucomicrobiota bacterium]
QMYGDENILDRLEALRIWTKGSAWFTGEEKEKGAIEKGQLADFALLDRDYLDIPDSEVRMIRSDMTVVGGRIVHGNGQYEKYAPVVPSLRPGWSPVNEFGGFYPNA